MPDHPQSCHTAVIAQIPDPAGSLFWELCFFFQGKGIQAAFTYLLDCPVGDISIMACPGTGPVQGLIPVFFPQGQDSGNAPVMMALVHLCMPECFQKCNGAFSHS